MPDLAAYRASAPEQARMQSLLRLLPARGRSVLDLGARDGHLAKLLVGRFERVVALDLEMPSVDDPRVECVKGNGADLQFEDGTFDAVVCAEVLEHVPRVVLSRMATEIARVTSHRVVIGVPYMQDLRFGQTTCPACGRCNPPWGHVNSFDKDDLVRLFDGLDLSETELLGTSPGRTNSLATRLMGYADNPYGTYGQEEPCVFCTARLVATSHRSTLQRIATRLAHWTNQIQAAYALPRPNWIHVAFDKHVQSRSMNRVTVTHEGR
jgi:SAM-dependent methyltransferase